MSFIPKLSVSQLGAISAVGGVITVVFAGFVRNRIAYNIERQPFCKEPMKLLRNHEGANYILGKGFQVKGIAHKSLSDNEDNFEEIRYRFPVSGTDGTGNYTIYSECQRRDNDNSQRACLVQKCFLEVDSSSNLDKEKYEGKQLIIYDRKRHGPLKYEMVKDNI